MISLGNPGIQRITRQLIAFNKGKRVMLTVDNPTKDKGARKVRMEATAYGWKKPAKNTENSNKDRGE